MYQASFVDHLAFKSDNPNEVVERYAGYEFMNGDTLTIGFADKSLQLNTFMNTSINMKKTVSQFGEDNVVIEITGKAMLPVVSAENFDNRWWPIKRVIEYNF